MPTPQYLTDYLSYNAVHYPDELALVTEDRTLTWAELERLVNNVSNRLAPLLLADEQQVVGLLMPNSWRYVVAYLAIVNCGHIGFPVDIIFKPLEIEAVINQIGPRLVITDKQNNPRLGDIKSEVIDIDDLLTARSQKRSPNFLRIGPDKQIASLFFTSGTTGQPKAAPYTHRNHIWNIEVCSSVWRWNHDDSLLLSLRLSHWYGTVMGLAGALYHGNTLFLQERFNAAATLELLSSGKISLFTHGPLVYAKLLEYPNRKSYDLSKVRLFISGSGPLPPPVWQEFKDIFGAEILEVYGTTETGRIASNLLTERIPGSPGRVLSGVQLKFDKHGQVMVKSGGLFPGYFKNDALTKTKLTSDGYWKTGDIGELKNGRLVLKSRLQERIRKQGYSISPRDVEWALHKDKRIKEALVMGTEHADSSDDRLVYFLSGDVTKAQVRQFCAENLPSVWRPDEIVILDSLPRTRTGKPQLAKLKAMLN